LPKIPKAQPRPKGAAEGLVWPEMPH
jgi:hypothetical protein